jgi:hypothetical protein
MYTCVGVWGDIWSCIHVLGCEGTFGHVYMCWGVREHLVMYTCVYHTAGKFSVPYPSLSLVSSSVAFFFFFFFISPPFSTFKMLYYKQFSVLNKACEGTFSFPLFLRFFNWILELFRQCGWLIDWCLTSSEQFFSYIQDENMSIINTVPKTQMVNWVALF